MTVEEGTPCKGVEICEVGIVFVFVFVSGIEN